MALSKLFQLGRASEELESAEFQEVTEQEAADAEVDAAAIPEIEQDIQEAEIASELQEEAIEALEEDVAADEEMIEENPGAIDEADVAEAQEKYMYFCGLMRDPNPYGPKRTSNGTFYPKRISRESSSYTPFAAFKATLEAKRGLLEAAKDNVVALFKRLWEMFIRMFGKLTGSDKALVKKLDSIVEKSEKFESKNIYTANCIKALLPLRYMCKGFKDDFEVSNVMEYATINCAKIVFDGETPDDRAKKIYDKIKSDVKVEYTKESGGEETASLENALKAIAGDIPIEDLIKHKDAKSVELKSAEEYKDMQKKIKDNPKYNVEGVLMPLGNSFYVSIRYNDVDRSRLIRINVKENESDKEPEEFENTAKRSEWIKKFGLKWKINSQGELQSEAQELIAYIKKTNRFESDVKHVGEKIKNLYDKLCKEKANKDTDIDRKKQIDLELKGLGKDFKTVVTNNIQYRLKVAQALTNALSSNIYAEDKIEGVSEKKNKVEDKTDKTENADDEYSEIWNNVTDKYGELKIIELNGGPKKGKWVLNHVKTKGKYFDSKKDAEYAKINIGNLKKGLIYEKRSKFLPRFN